MNEEGKRQYEEVMRGYLRQQITRANLLKAAGIGLAAAAIPGAANAAGPNIQSFPFYPAVKGTYSPESVSTILDTALTAEYLAVTALTAALQNASALKLTGLLLDVVQAALVEEFAHLDFLRNAGATPLTTTFTVPDPKILTDQTTFLSTLEVLETAFVGAYMAAVREFAEIGQPTLAKYAYQIGAVEAEHRVLVRAAFALAGEDHTPPNNKAFETDLFVYVSDAGKALAALGFLGGSGTPATYPGDAAVKAQFGPMASAVIQTTPNNATTSVISTNAADHLKPR